MSREVVPPSLPPREYPALAAEHIAGAQLFANRYDLLASLDLPPNSVIGEIGVSRGDCSEYLIRQFQPQLFVAFDTFDMHTWPDCWGIPTEDFLSGKKHLQYFMDRLSFYLDRIAIEAGRSEKTLATQPNDTFDLIYVDAMHDYCSVKTDVDLSIPLLKQKGYLVFNDYVVFDHFSGTHYGVVEVVNDLVVNHGWKVSGFALERQMFCDIAIRR